MNRGRICRLTQELVSAILSMCFDAQKGRLVMEKGIKQAARANVAQLLPGESGIVDTVGGEGALHRHLLDMGITPGVRITLQKTAPMGDPLEIHLRGYALTLRKDDAAKITLRQGEAKQA